MRKYLCNNPYSVLFAEIYLNPAHVVEFQGELHFLYNSNKNESESWNFTVKPVVDSKMYVFMYKGFTPSFENDFNSL